MVRERVFERKDRDDDPNTPKDGVDGELPGSSKTSGMPATS